MLSEVHTTPPMSRADTMPSSPPTPTDLSTTEEMIRVMRVMPLTGLLPTMAMARAATVVNRKAMPPTMARPTRLCTRFTPGTRNRKKAKVAARVKSEPAGDQVHGQVALGALHRAVGGGLGRAAGRQLHRAHDDVAALPHTDEAGHGDGADAHGPHEVGEDLHRVHGPRHR